RVGLRHEAPNVQFARDYCSGELNTQSECPCRTSRNNGYLLSRYTPQLFRFRHCLNERVMSSIRKPIVDLLGSASQRPIETNLYLGLLAACMSRINEIVATIPELITQFNALADYSPSIACNSVSQVIH